MLLEERYAEVQCEFKILPTLGMFIEAAAQCAAAFNQEAQVKVGFLSMAKNVELLEEVHEKRYLFQLIKEAEIQNYKQFSFEAYTLNKALKVLQGQFTLVLET
ncbi:MAG: Unknown protein [uncultured Sulfurovum sp.]|uniref:Uncharacterized protein n=1 Tax=uncultured Sulfurovum sp. TaxID=269237 RepID=A0A6S6TCB8_9BACT|nr:MAG: Unknown protein [uncultured Sulfurovum sp.]